MPLSHLSAEFGPKLNLHEGVTTTESFTLERNQKLQKDNALLQFVESASDGIVNCGSESSQLVLPLCPQLKIIL